MVRTMMSLAAAATLAAAPAFSQEAGQDPGAGVVTGAQADREYTIEPGEDVVIATGRRLDGFTFEEYVYEFVDELFAPVSPNFGIARWEEEVCVGTINLEPDAAQYVVNRVSDLAVDVGLRAGEPGCRPDIMLLFTTDGPALATQLVEEQGRLFRPFGGTGGVNRGFEALDEFVSSDDPVRWWQVSIPVGWDGTIAVDLPGDTFDAPRIRGANSLLVRPTRGQMLWTVVIVDVTKTTALNWTQLADYLAVVSLAQIDPEANTSGYDSILNVFDDTSVRSLTSFDRSYLRSLYRFDVHLKPRVQQLMLAKEMTHDQLSLTED